MKKGLTIGIIFVAVVALIVLVNWSTGWAVFSTYETIQEGKSKQIGFEGMLYTISAVQIIDGDNVIISVTSSQTDEVQTIQSTEWKSHILNEEIGKAKVYVERISKTGGQYGDFVRVRIEPAGSINVYGWKLK